MNLYQNGYAAIFAEGYESGRNGEHRRTNPHAPYSKAGLHWFLGWYQGQTKRDWANAKSDPDTSRQRLD